MHEIRHLKDEGMYCICVARDTFFSFLKDETLLLGLVIGVAMVGVGPRVCGWGGVGG